MVFAGRLIPVGGTTLTLRVASVISGLLALVLIVTDPFATLVTGTLTIVEPAGIVTLEGTVAIVGSLDVNGTVSAVGGGADRFRFTFCVAMPPMVRLVGENDKLPFTLTV